MKKNKRTAVVSRREKISLIWLWGIIFFWVSPSQALDYQIPLWFGSMPHTGPHGVGKWGVYKIADFSNWSATTPLVWSNTTERWQYLDPVITYTNRLMTNKTNSSSFAALAFEVQYAGSYRFDGTVRLEGLDGSLKYRCYVVKWAAGASGAITTIVGVAENNGQIVDWDLGNVSVLQNISLTVGQRIGFIIYSPTDNNGRYGVKADFHYHSSDLPIIVGPDIGPIPPPYEPTPARQMLLEGGDKYRIIMFTQGLTGYLSNLELLQIQQAKAAQFNVAGNWAKDQSLGAIAYQTGMAASEGLFYMTAMRLNKRADNPPLLTWEEGTEQVMCAPDSDELWAWLEEEITGLADVSLDNPDLIGVFLDVENYWNDPPRPAGYPGDLYPYSYDQQILDAFAIYMGITIPSLAPGDRRGWLVSQGYADDFEAFSEYRWSLRVSALRSAVDAINPRFQFLFCPGEARLPFVTGALYDDSTTVLAPSIYAGEATYGRMPTSLTPQETALATNKYWLETTQGYLAGTIHQQIGGIDPGYRGADPEYSARNAIMISETVDGYWVFYEDSASYGTSGYFEFMDWFEYANTQILTQNWPAQQEPRQTPEPALAGHIGMYLKPYTDDPMSTAAISKSFSRVGHSAYVLMAQAGETITGQASVENIRPDVRPDADFVITDPEGMRLYYDHIAPGGSKTFSYTVDSEGLYSIVMDAEKNLGSIVVDNQYFCMIIPEDLVIAYGPKEAYFMALKNADEVRAWISRGVCKVDLFDPSGTQVTFGDDSPIFHPAGPGEDEKPWSLRTRPGIPTRNEAIQNLTLALGDDCGELLAVDPTRLLMPTDVPQYCQQAIAMGYGFSGDLNEDCQVNMQDMALLTPDWSGEGDFQHLIELGQQWLSCMDPDVLMCATPWQ